MAETQFFESFLPRDLLQKPILEQELKSTKTLFDAVRLAQNPTVPIEKRGEAWTQALDVVTDKRYVKQQVMQNVQPAQYHEPIIDTSMIDTRIIENYSSELSSLLSQGKTDTHASFAIVEYFLRTNYHHLNGEQITALAQTFRPRQLQESFQSYKTAIEHGNQTLVLPDKTADESWVIRRETMDLLEITDHIKTKYLAGLKGKTIHISDLMRVSADALHTVHTAGSFMGAQRINEQDRMLCSGAEISSYRNINKETIGLCLTRPDVLLSMVLTQQPRDFGRDIQRLLRLPESIQVVGRENIPSDGPILIAFSHMNAWKDAKIPPNWEMTKMIEQIRSRRTDTIGLMSYINYFKETAPAPVKPIINWFIDEAIKKANEWYGIAMLEVNPLRTQKLLQETMGMLGQGHAVLLSPEAAPAREVLRPKRGIGSMARLSGSPVLGVAFREDKRSDGTFNHSVIFTQPHIYEEQSLQGNTPKEKEQAFADMIMRDIAFSLPEEQRGVFR